MAYLKKAMRADDGQSIVEFSLVAPVAILVLLGAIQVILMASMKVALVNGAFESARSAALQAEGDPEGAKVAAQNILEERMGFLPIAPGFLARKPSILSIAISEGEVAVTASADQELLPLVKQWFGFLHAAGVVSLATTATVKLEDSGEGQ